MGERCLGDGRVGQREPPIQLMVTIALTAISYVFAYFLAPEVN